MLTKKLVFLALKLKNKSMKLNKIALIAILLLSLIIVFKTCLAIADLYFRDEPIFYRFQTCPEIKFGVSWTQIVANLVILIAAFLLYRFFNRVVEKAIWKSRDARLLVFIFIINVTGFFLSKLSILIANDFLVKPSEIGCPIYTNLITSQFYISNAVMEFVFDPLFLILTLCMALLSTFLKYSYSIKEENESFI